MTDDRLPNHSRLVDVVIGIVLLIVAIPLILLLILDVLTGGVVAYPAVTTGFWMPVRPREPRWRPYAIVGRAHLTIGPPTIRAFGAVTSRELQQQIVEEDELVLALLG